MAVQGAVKLRDVKLSLTTEMKWSVEESSSMSMDLSACVQQSGAACSFTAMNAVVFFFFSRDLDLNKIGSLVPKHNVSSMSAHEWAGINPRVPPPAGVLAYGDTSVTVSS